MEVISGLIDSITVELWLWLGKELGPDFQSTSDMRLIREEFVGEGRNDLPTFGELDLDGIP